MNIALLSLRDTMPLYGGKLHSSYTCPDTLRGAMAVFSPWATPIDCPPLAILPTPSAAHFLVP